MLIFQEGHDESMLLRESMRGPGPAVFWEDRWGSLGIKKPESVRIRVRCFDGLEH